MSAKANANKLKPLYKLNSPGYIKLTQKQSIQDNLIENNLVKINQFCYPVGTQKLRAHN